MATEICAILRNHHLNSTIIIERATIAQWIYFEFIIPQLTFRDVHGGFGIFDSLPINFSYLGMSNDFQVDLLIKLYVSYISVAYRLLKAKEIIKFQRLVIRNGMPLIYINCDIANLASTPLSCAENVLQVKPSRFKRNNPEVKSERQDFKLSFSNLANSVHARRHF